MPDFYSLFLTQCSFCNLSCYYTCIVCTYVRTYICMCIIFIAFYSCLLKITGVPSIVPSVTISDVPLTLSWGEPFNNLDPVVNYIVSCLGDALCPPNFTTTDNTTRSYTITNLTPMTNYTFSVVATNSIGSGEAGVVMITTPSSEKFKSGISQLLAAHV